jgi:hypothetical protein
MMPRYDSGCYGPQCDGRRPAPSAYRDDPSRRLTAVYCLLGRTLYGDGGQDYIWEAIAQFRRFHPAPTYPVYVILDEVHANDARVAAQVARHSVTVVSSAVLAADPVWTRHKEVFYVQGVMKPGRNDQFNQMVSARFFAIHALMRLRNLRNVVHFENDNMVYANYQPVMDAALHTCGWRLASFAASTEQFIPGIVLIRDVDSLAPFLEHLNDMMACGRGFGAAVTPGFANDMTYFLDYYRLLGGGWLGTLPTGPTDSIAGGNEAFGNCVTDQLVAWSRAAGGGAVWSDVGLNDVDLGSQQQQGRNAAPSRLLAKEAVVLAAEGGGELAPLAAGGGERFGPIFDCASFGQWYSFAVDEERRSAPDVPAGPFKSHEELRAHFELQFKLAAEATLPGEVVSTKVPPYVIRLTMKARYMDATPEPYVVWGRDGAGRRIPVWRGRRLLSLHIHAKNLGWFRS